MKRFPRSDLGVCPDKVKKFDSRQKTPFPKSVTGRSLKLLTGMFFTPIVTKWLIWSIRRSKTRHHLQKSRCRICFYPFWKFNLNKRDQLARYFEW